MTVKKICIVTPTLGCGGVERVVSELSNYSSERGISVTIICLFSSETHYTLNDSIKVIKPNFEYRKRFTGKVRTFFYLAHNLLKVKADSVLGFSEAFNPLTVLASKLTFNKVYISDRSSPSKKFKKLVNLGRRATYPLANGVISQTESAKLKLVEKNLNQNIVIIPNPLREINDSLIKKNGKTIVSVGKLIPSKNFSFLLDAFNSLEDADDWELVILGDGPERAYLEEKVIRHNLGGRVFFKGAVKEIDKYFSDASIFAFPSVSEGFPNALSEAMAFPLACVAFDCDAGPSDIISHHNNGFLIPISKPDEFKNKLQLLVSTPQLVSKYMSVSFENREKFSRTVICEKFLKFILND